MTRLSGRSVPILLSLFVGLTVAVLASAEMPATKRVFIVQSYEDGHVCGSPQAQGFLEALATEGWMVGRNLTVKTYFMDTYRKNATPEAMRQQGEIALRQISEFRPDLVAIMDDAAAIHVMLPLVGSVETPIVFTGMNGQPELYNQRKKYMDTRTHPGGQVTGVYEKLYAAESLRVMAAAVPALRTGRAVMITDHSPTGNGLTKQFELELANINDIRWEIRRVQDWQEYTAIIEALNQDESVKVIYPVALTLQVSPEVRYAAAQIYDWTLAHSRKPEMAINYFFARMGLFGGAVVNFESMGRLGGRKAAAIFKGVKPGDLPIEDAPDYAIVFNLKRAKDLGITVPPTVLGAADLVYKDDLRPLSGRPLLYDPKSPEPRRVSSR